MSRPSLLERAYELARAGDCSGVTDIRKRLQAEGYPANEIIGKALMDDLARHCRIAQGKPAGRPPPPQPATAEERSERSRKAAESRRANRPPVRKARPADEA